MIFLGVDCGTQSLKVLVWDADGGRSVSASRSYEMVEGLPPGHKEQRPSDWIDALENCLGALASKGVPMERVEAIGVSGQQHGLVALDAERRVLRPAKLWCDTSTSAQCRRVLEAAGGPQAYQEEIGNLLPPGFTASKVLWLKENEPEIYRRLRWMLLPHDYLNFHLTGELTAEPGDASGTGYFRVRQRQWSTRALAWIDADRDLAECLPRLIDCDAPAGRLRADLARRWGMKSDVVVSSGGGDNMMGAIGTGNVVPGVVTASLGTSGTLYAHSDAPIVDPRGEIAAFCGSVGGWLPLACTMNVTVATTMIQTGFGIGDPRRFDQAVESVPPGADGLFMVPYVEGERLPNVPDGTGVLVGLRQSTAGPAHLARAAMEGATMGLRCGLDRLFELGVEATEIRLTGGGSASRVWRRIVADVFELPVVCPRDREGAALGAALQALWCRTGGAAAEIVSRRCSMDESTRTLPDPKRVELYRELFQLYSEASRSLIASNVFPGHRKFISSRGEVQ